MRTVSDGPTKGTKISCVACGHVAYTFVRDVGEDDVIMPSDFTREDARLPDPDDIKHGDPFPDCPECGTPLIFMDDWDE